jgi:hypothetical protein
MCLPVVVAAIAVASTIYGVVKQKQNAKNQEKALTAAAAVQREQIYDQHSLQAQQRMHQAQAERARLRAASAETGLSGISITDTLNNVDFQAGTDVANIEKGNYNEINASNTMLQSRYNMIQQPDYIAAGLSIAGSAAGAMGGGAGGGAGALSSFYDQSTQYGPPSSLAGG